MVYEPLKMVFAILGVEIGKKLLKIWECLAQEKKRQLICKVKCLFSFYIE